MAGLLRELGPCLALDHVFFIRADERLKGGYWQVDVGRGARILLGGVQGLLEAMAVDTEHGLAVHLNQSPIGVPGEVFIPRLLRQAMHTLVVQADIQNRFHHPGHGELRTRAHGNQQGVLRITECLAHVEFEACQRGIDLRRKNVRHGARGQICPTGFGGDGESGWHGQTQAGHFGKVRPLATEEVLLIAMTE